MDGSSAPALRYDKVTLYGFILPLLVCIAGIYYWYITITPTLNPINFYGMLAESFLQGHTYLLHYQPRPELLALPDPYDSNVSRDLALWDASLYNNHYYLYFGPVPALLIAPIEYFTHRYFPDPLLVWGFSSVGTISLCLLLFSMTRSQQMVPRAGIIISILAISIGTWIPFMLRRPSFYEVALSGGYCFTALGFLLLWKSMHAPFPRRWMLAASLCLGLAFGCRPLYIFNLGALGLVWLFCKRGSYVTRLFTLFTPYAFCVICLMLYNYARFDSPFEGGLHYQITIFNVHAADYQPLKLAKIFSNFYYYFLRPIGWRPDFHFPFVNVTYYDAFMLPNGSLAETLEPLYGLFGNSPFSLFIFAGIYCVWQKRQPFERSALTLLAGVLLYMLPVIAYLMCFIFSTMRYAVDFSPWLMLLAAVFYLRLLTLARTRKYQILLLSIGGVATGFGMLTGMLAGYCGQYLCEGM